MAGEVLNKLLELSVCCFCLHQIVKNEATLHDLQMAQREKDELRISIEKMDCRLRDLQLLHKEKEDCLAKIREQEADIDTLRSDITRISLEKSGFLAEKRGSQLPVIYIAVEIMLSP